MLLIRLVQSLNPIFELSNVKIYLLDTLITHLFLSGWIDYDTYVGFLKKHRDIVIDSICPLCYPKMLDSI